MFETDPPFGGGIGLAGAREFQFEPDLSELVFVGEWGRHSNFGILPEETGLTQFGVQAEINWGEQEPENISKEDDIAESMKELDSMDPLGAVHAPSVLVTEWNSSSLRGRALD